MIDALEHRRLDDGERVGYLRAEGDLVVPLTLIGTPLAGPMESAAAATLLDERGLAILNERWWCRLPTPVTAGLDVSTPQLGWDWRAVLIIEASPDSCTVRVENATVEEFMSRLRLPVPVGDLLVKNQP